MKKNLFSMLAASALALIGCNQIESPVSSLKIAEPMPQTTASSSTSNTITFGSGAMNVSGRDPEHQLVSCSGSACGTSTFPVSAWIVGRHGAYASTIVGTNWISSHPQGTSIGGAGFPGNTEATFHRTFSTPSNAVSATITIRMSADNAITARVNGTHIATHGNANPNVCGFCTDNSPGSYTVSFTPDPSGTNTLELALHDWGGVLALNYTATVTYELPPPTPRNCPDNFVPAATAEQNIFASAFGGIAQSKPLDAGVTYIVEASGTYGFGGKNTSISADAGYRTANNWAVYSGPDANFQLQINGAFTDWGDFNLAHTYQIALVGTGDAITFRITDDAYGDNNGGLSASITRCVPASQPTTTTVSFGPGPFVYNGSAFTATASVSPAEAGAATITYSGDCVNAGNTCTATATFAGSAGFDPSSATASITIEKAPTSTSTSFGSGPFVYTGSAFTATASVNPAAAGSATISYAGDCVNAGNSCTATATFAGNGNYLPSSADAGITIAKAPTSTSVTFGSGPFIYTGSTFTATATVSPTAAGAATISYAGDCVYAGNTCSATATFAGNGNYLSSSASAGITIKYPVAASSNQCKDGGWRYATDDLGNLFKNQGDCVSYVATKGKNKGAGR